MSNQILQMKYHPAKKEVEFKRFQNNKEIIIRKDSRLSLYMNKKGKFVLQDYGNDFLQDIVGAFDGEKNVNMQVITTKIDFEDLMQMIEFFNEESKCSIDATLLAELPDMDETYEIVKNHGEKSIDILKSNKSKFWDIPLNNVTVRECVESFSSDLDIELENIKEKIYKLRDNTVNLCFAGVYSAGKSALINAILGYAILPENIKSETARMFKIQSPKYGEAVRIIFSIKNSYAEVMWNDNLKYFEFVAGPTESRCRESIQNTINENKDKDQHNQLKEILKTLNLDDDVCFDINIFFPIPLDNDKVQFTIYDTPGTDSNFASHQSVLKDSLSEQTHSILIFVVTPLKLEGEGNNVLLNYLKEAEEKSIKSTIDIGRSLFVMNQVDERDPDALKELSMAKIKDKNDESKSIKLSDKKLFYTSAKIAYSAKAKMNNIATKNEEFTIKKQSGTIDDPYFGCYFQYNRCATSEYATSKIIEKSQKELNDAQIQGDTLKKLYICSGLYALENEITTYGEKYAAAVKAYAIIDSVDKALSKINNNAKSLENKNQQDINKIYNEIEVLRKTITEEIKKVANKYEIKDNSLPENTIKELSLDSESLNSELIRKPKTFIDKLLKGWLCGIGKVRFKEKNKVKINEFIINVLNDYTNNFLEKRQKLLEETRNKFINDVKTAIRNNGEITSEAKDFILQIREPEIKKVIDSINEFGEMYDNHKRTDKILWIETDNLDKKGFINDVEEKLLSISKDIHDDYKNDFKKSFDSILLKVEKEFTGNLNTYSKIMKAKLQDKAAMEALRLKIIDTANALNECKDELNSVIWKVKNNE